MMGYLTTVVDKSYIKIDSFKKGADVVINSGFTIEYYTIPIT